MTQRFDPQSAPPHIVIDENTRTLRYGPSMYEWSQRADFSSIKGDLAIQCQQRTRVIESMPDDTQLEGGTTIGQWRAWFAERKDG